MCGCKDNYPSEAKRRTPHSGESRHVVREILPFLFLDAGENLPNSFKRNSFFENRLNSLGHPAVDRQERLFDDALNVLQSGCRQGRFSTGAQIGAKSEVFGLDNSLNVSTEESGFGEQGWEAALERPLNARVQILLADGQERQEKLGDRPFRCYDERKEGGNRNRLDDQREQGQ